MLLSRRRMDRHSPFCLLADGNAAIGNLLKETKHEPQICDGFYDGRKDPCHCPHQIQTMIEGFKNAIAEERKKGASEARIAAILHYVETTSSDIDPDAMEWMRIELAEATKATNRGPGTVQ